MYTQLHLGPLVYILSTSPFTSTRTHALPERSMVPPAPSPDIPFAVQHIFDASLGDNGIITLEPLVFVLPDEAGVVATLQGPLMVNDSKQGVPGMKGEDS